MKLGLGLAAPHVTEENLQFAVQMGVTHLFANGPDLGEHTFELDALIALRERVEAAGLVLAGIENFPQRYWWDVLTDGPQRDAQLDHLSELVDHMGQAGIPILGYYFSIAKVWGHWRAYDAGGGRGDAGLKSFDYARVHDAEVHERGPVSGEQMWERAHVFLEHLVPVAASAGVRLAAHQDDPPARSLQGTGRLLTSHDAIQRYLDLVDSPFNGLEFCQGTVAEMDTDRTIEAIRRFASQDRIVYVHFRNVRGSFPAFDEVFHDEGDVDMLDAMAAYHECGFDGVMTPDHTPRVVGDAPPGLKGRAFALGYMRGLMQAVERGTI